MAEHLGHVGNLPINPFAFDGDQIRTPVSLAPRVVCMRPQVEVDIFLEKGNLRTPE